MKLIVEIDDEIYKTWRQEGKYASHSYAQKIILNGTPLPKGHGDLIDRSTLEPDTEWSDWDDGLVSYSYGQIAAADVVIKADKEEE